MNYFQCLELEQQAEPVAAPAEPVMIYHGEYTIDCGNHGHHNVELLKLIAAGTKLYAGPRHPEPVSTDQAARLALDALTEMTQPQRTASESDRYKRVRAAMSALESALSKQADQVAVQAEPGEDELPDRLLKSHQAAAAAAVASWERKQAEPVTEEMVDAARAHYIALERSGAIGLSVAAVQEMIEAHKQSEPAQAEPDITAMFCLAQTFTDWNRQHSPPPVRVGFEIAVFAEAAKRIIAQQQTEPVGEPVADDCTPNHFCGYRWIHKPIGEICNRCGHAGSNNPSF